MTEAESRTLLSTIQKERCALIVGPEMPLIAGGKSTFRETLKAILDKEGLQNVPYYSEDGFFYFKNARERLQLFSALEQHYDSLPEHPAYTKLAQIPFHLVISLSPDLLLRRAFERQIPALQFDYYKARVKPAELKPSAASPLLYNLLGNIEDHDSLVFTYEALFDYLPSVLGGYTLSDVMRESLRQVNYYLLLGVGFDSWYLRLLFRLLGLGVQDHVHEALTDIQAVDDKTRQFYRDVFRIEFVNGNETAFVEELHGYCSEKNALRQAQKPRISEQINALLAQDDLDAALARLRQAIRELGDPNWEQQHVQISGSMAALKNDILDGVLDQNEIQIRRNTLRRNIGELAARIEEQE